MEVPVETPANKTTPKQKPVEIEQIQNQMVMRLVTPKKPDGGTYPPGTKVEIPGEDEDNNYC